jgi:hypothetical protein
MYISHRINKNQRFPSFFFSSEKIPGKKQHKQQKAAAPVGERTKKQSIYTPLLRHSSFLGFVNSNKQECGQKKGGKEI